MDVARTMRSDKKSIKEAKRWTHAWAGTLANQNALDGTKNYKLHLPPTFRSTTSDRLLRSPEANSNERPEGSRKKSASLVIAPPSSRRYSLTPDQQEHSLQLNLRRVYQTTKPDFA